MLKILDNMMRCWLNQLGILLLLKIHSGIGIIGDSLDKIFEPLYTTKSIGVGLGLSSCKSIIEQYGGVVKAKNNPTTFTIMMPKNPEKQQEKIIQSS